MAGQKTVVMQNNLNARRYINIALRSHAIPLLHSQRHRVTFKHDNATPP